MCAAIPRVSKLHLQIAIVALAAIAALGALYLIPVNQRNIVTFGVDAYENHQPILDTRTAEQEIVISRQLQGIGVIAVNMRRAPIIPDIHVQVVDLETHTDLASEIIQSASIVDDQFAYTRFEPPIQSFNRRAKVIFSAPEATSANPIGIRFHDKDEYAAGFRLRNNAPVTGDLAVALVEKVPLGRYIATTLYTHRAISRIIVSGLCIALIYSFLSLLPYWQRIRKYKFAYLVVLVALSAAVTLLHLQLLPRFGGVSGGDPYNYLFITQKIMDFENPFENAKRLPGYPLLLIPALQLSIDDQWWMRFLSTLAAGGSLVLTGLLARQLRLPWPVQLGAVLLLALHKDFFWTSFRPEPYTMYTFLLLAAVILFFNLHRTTWHRIGYGLALGYAAMVRQEGFVLAALLGICSIIFWRKVWLGSRESGTDKQLEIRQDARTTWLLIIRRWLMAFLPALIIVSPFFIHNVRTYGNPIYTPYFEGERLQIVNSWDAFVDNAGATWGVLGSMWSARWDELTRVPTSEPLFLASFILGIAWWLSMYWQWWARTPTRMYILMALWAAVLLATIYVAVGHKPLFVHSMAPIASGFAFASLIAVVVAARWRGLIVVLVALSQILVATWFHPFAKHFQQVYPLLCLMLATLLFPELLRSRTAKRISPRLVGVANAMYRVAVLMPFILVSLFLFIKLPIEMDHYNAAIALDSVVYRAVQYARNEPGPWGVDQAYLPARLYFHDQGDYFWGDEPHTPEDEQRWLQENQTVTLIITNNSKSFQVRPEWQELAHFKAEGKNDRLFESWVYHIPNDTHLQP